MAINQQNKEKLKARMGRAIGHLNAVYRMVDDERYCIDVIHQLKAVQAALDRTSEEILKAHLESCVVEAIRNQDERRVMDELIEVFRKSPNLYSAADETVMKTALPVDSVVEGAGPKGSPSKDLQKIGCCGS